MNGFSKHIVQGTLGRDPEFKLTAKGTEMCKAGLAVGEWNAAKRESKTTWHSVLAFGKNANILKNARKGDSVLVSGRLVSDDGQDGKTYWTTIADDVQCFGPARKRAEDEARASKRAESPDAENQFCDQPKTDDKPEGAQGWQDVAGDEIPF